MRKKAELEDPDSQEELYLSLVSVRVSLSFSLFLSVSLLCSGLMSLSPIYVSGSCISRCFNLAHPHSPHLGFINIM